MARLLDWITGLEVVARAPLTGPRTVGSSSTEAIQGYVQTTASPFGLWRWELTIRPMRHVLFRRYRGMVTALHGGANAVRIPWCDPDLFWPDAGVTATRQQITEGMPWVIDIPANDAPAALFGDMFAAGGLAAAFDGVTNAPAAASAGKASAADAYLGCRLATAKRIASAIVWPSSDQGFATGGEVRLELYGRNGSLPLTATDGDLLAAVFADSVIKPRRLEPPAGTAAYQNSWVRIIPVAGPAATRIAEFDLTEFIASEPWEDTDKNWKLGRPTVPVIVGSLKGTDIIFIGGSAWGTDLVGGEWLGFEPNHFGLYIVTQVFPLEPGKYRIWPPLRKTINRATFATLSPVIAMRLENEAGATSGRGPVMADNAVMTLVEVEDEIVRNFFTD